MKYFIDTEFIEDFHKPVAGKRRHYIDLISIGIVAEDGREYYAVSSEFDLKAVWNKYDLKAGSGDQRNLPPRKVYWLRENVLEPIFWDLVYLHKERGIKGIQDEFNYTNLRKYISEYGKSNEQIAQEIRNFIYSENINDGGQLVLGKFFPNKQPEPEFYGYFADYDWVLFCSLYGKMLNLPDAFPMYCRDLKQMLDEKAAAKDWYYGRDIWSNTPNRGKEIQPGDFLASIDDKIKKIKSHNDYPKQDDEHNALADARWNKKLYEFLIKL